MAASLWKPLPQFLPVDGATVWVTPANQFSGPYQATWDLASATFTDATNSLVSPWWTIVRWKPV